MYYVKLTLSEIGLLDPKALTLGNIRNAIKLPSIVEFKSLIGLCLFFTIQKQI